MSDKINVLICEPLTAPYMKEIDSSLESLQATVGGGLIQAIYPFEDQVALVCNDCSSMYYYSVVNVGIHNGMSKVQVENTPLVIGHE